MITTTTGPGQQKMKARERVRLERHLGDLHHRIAESEGQLRVDRIEAGEVLTALRASFQHGQWMTYSADLYKRLKLSRKTAERYITAYKEVASFGPALRDAAKKSGLDLNKPIVRDYMKEVRTENPDASTDEIVKLTNMAMEAAAKEDEEWRCVEAEIAEFERCKHPGCFRKRIFATRTAVGRCCTAQSDFCEEHEPPEKKAQREAEAEKWAECFRSVAGAFGRGTARRPSISPELLKCAKEIVESG